MIRRISNKDIDKVLWDNCISNSLNETIYPYSWYLDKVSPGWEALVLDNYKAAFPLTKKKKFGHTYLMQPANSQQLGIFSTSKLDEKEITGFYSYLTDNYKFINIQVNKYFFASQQSGLKETEKRNYILDLNRDYNKIFSEYSTNHRRNIKKAIDNGIITEQSSDISTLINIYKENQGKYLRHTEEEYKTLKKVVNKCLSMGKAEIIIGKTAEGKICAGAVFAKSHKRNIFLFSSTDSTAKSLGTMHYIIDEFIMHNAGQNIILDFEGSNEENLARFYSGFGASEEKYYKLYLNNLPGIIKLIKK